MAIMVTEKEEEEEGINCVCQHCLDRAHMQMCKTEAGRLDFHETIRMDLYSP